MTTPSPRVCFRATRLSLLEGGAFADVAEARLESFNYIEGYYNRIRRHSSLGYVSPEEYERRVRGGKRCEDRESS